MSDLRYGDSVIRRFDGATAVVIDPYGCELDPCPHGNAGCVVVGRDGGGFPEFWPTTQVLHNEPSTGPNDG